MDVTNEGLCTVAVTNCAPYPISIKRGSVIGFIQIESDQGKIKSLSEMFESINLLNVEATYKQKLTRDEIAQKVKHNVQQSFVLDTWIFYLNTDRLSVFLEQIWERQIFLSQNLFITKSI